MLDKNYVEFKNVSVRFSFVRLVYTPNFDKIKQTIFKKLVELLAFELAIIGFSYQNTA